MRKSFQLIFFLLFLWSSGWSQKYFIEFKDKDLFDVNICQKHLSERSIDRRAKQNILLAQTDMPVRKAYLDSLQSLGIQVKYISKWLNGVLIEVTNVDLINTLKAKSYVSNLHNLENNTYGGTLKIVDTDFGANLNNANFFNVELFHNQGVFGDKKMLAVFDGGFLGVNTSAPFKDLSIADAYSFKYNSKDVYQDFTHGTNVLSIVSANELGKFVGFAPKASVALYVTEDESTEKVYEEYYWLFAAERADSLGVDVINSSLGYYDFVQPSQNHVFSELDGNTSVISKAANLASEKGILVVSSAGNSNLSSTWPYITFPSDAPLVLSVGAIEENGQVSDFSSRGPVNNTYFKPELVAPGRNVSVLNQLGNKITSSGTSFSAPMISGLALLLWCKHPNLTAQEVKKTLIDNSSNAQNPTNEIGYGYPSTKKMLGIENSLQEKKIIFVEYLDILGRYIGNNPIGTGVYLRKVWYQDYTFVIEKTFIE